MKKLVVKITLAVCLLSLFFSSCSQDETITYQLNSKLVELKCDKTFALQLTPAMEGLTYTSLNTNIATVSSSGLIKAKLVGTTKIVVKDALNSFIDTVKVVVKSMHTAFADPVLSYGTSAESILSSIDLTTYYYAYYQYDEYNYMYLYDQTATDDYFTRYYYYFSKDDELLISNIYLEDNGELEEHMSSRYNEIRTFVVNRKVTYISDTDTVSTTYQYVESFFINPDSTILVLQDKSARSAYSDIYYFKASKEIIDRILSVDEEYGNVMYSWIMISTLYPDEDIEYIFESPKKRSDVSTMNRIPMFRQPDKLRLPDKQLHGLGYP